MDKVSVGIVGAGFAAKFHLDSCKRVFGVPVQIVGLTSPTNARRGKMASDYGVDQFDSLHQMMIEKTVDIVDICAPGFAHEKLAVEALEGGCHVVIEKPFTGYHGDGSDKFRGDRSPKGIVLQEALASSNRILDAAKRAQRKIRYAENWIYSPAIQKEVGSFRK